MRVIARSLMVTLAALLGAIVLAVSWTTATAVQLQAVTALIMGGANHSLDPDSDPPEFVTAYLDNAVDSYINPAADAGTGTTGSPDNLVAVIYPAEFFPVFGTRTFDESVEEGRQNLHRCLDGSDCVFNDEVGSEPPAPGDTFIVFGYSESAVVASLVKRDLIDDYQEGDTTSFILVSNPMRPNGGILMRGEGLPTIPILGITFYGATPTNSPVIDEGDPADPTDDTYAYPTVDVAQQYDALGGDFPYRPLNLLATANSLAAYYYLHGDVINRPLSEAEFQGRHGDTSYYLFTAETLPILMPLQQAGVPSPILRLLDAPLRVIVEDAYRRDVSPGVPTRATLVPIGNPIALALNVLAAVPVGIDDALEELGVGRALGTEPAGPFGVGGPELPDPSSTTSTSTLAVTTPPVEEATAQATDGADAPPADLVGRNDDEPDESDATDEDPREDNQEGVDEEGVDEEGVDEEGVDEEAEETTPDPDTPPVTEPDRTEAPSAQPDDDEEPTSDEPDADADGGEGDAAA